MSRQAYVEVATYVDPESGDLKPADQAEVFVYEAGTTKLVSIYESRSGSTLLSNPFIIGENGLVEFWSVSGDYDIKFHDTKAPTRFGDYTIGWQSSPVDTVIDAGELSNEGDLEWTQDPKTGAWIPHYKTLPVSKLPSIVKGGVSDEKVRFIGPAVSVLRESSQSISNKAWTAILFPEERFDTDSAHSTSVNTSRLIAPIDGIYSAGATCDFDSNNTGVRIARIVKWEKGSEGSPKESCGEILIPGQTKVEEGAAGNAMNIGARPVSLNSGDWLTFEVYQNSGGSLNVSGSDGIHKSEFGMYWIRPL